MATTTVTATYLTPNGDPCVGRVTFKLVAATYHDGLDAIFPTSPVTGVLDSGGELSVELEPTSGVDAGFDSTTMTYQVDERINGAQRDFYYVDIPTAPAVDLGTLTTYDDPPGQSRVFVTPDLSTLGYQTVVEADAAYARIRGGRGNRAVFMGDSIMLSSELVAGQRAISPAVYGSITSYQRLNYVANVAVGGDTSSEMLARFDTAVNPHEPSVVVILAGTNDSNDSEAATLALFSANITEMVARTRALSAVPILCTVPPNNTGAARKDRISTYNAWLRRYCGSEGITLVDFYGLLVDPENGNYLAAYLNDGTHPNNPGYAAMGRLLGSVAYATLPAADVLVPLDNVDPNNLISGGLFLTTTGAGATLAPTGWTVVSSVHPANVTADLVTGDTAIKGNWWRLVSTGSAITDGLYQIISGITPAHVYVLCGRVKATSLSGGATVTARALYNSVTLTPGYDWRAMSTLGYDLADGVFWIETTAPSDAATCQMNLQFNAGSGTYQVAQLGFYDLTAMGIT